MSEVSDATQIVVITGKSAYLLGKTSLKIFIGILKMMNTIYLSKWKGKTSLMRFRQIKGDDFQFINIGTEDKEVLKGIEKEMKAHGILMGKLPDLCGGDGRTQYVISPDDMGKFKAFLLDHENGKYKDIKVGLISAEDYAKTGYDSHGEPTEEVTALMLQENVQMQTKTGKKKSGEALLMGRNIYSPEISHRLQKREKEIEYRDNIKFFKMSPIKSHEKWEMYEMPDGIHAVIVPKEDTIPKSIGASGKISPQVGIYSSKNYVVVDMRGGEYELTTKTGREVRNMMHQEPIHNKNRRYKNINMNTEKSTEKIAAIKSQIKKTGGRK